MSCNIMIAATGSGRGKTTFTTGLLYVLKEMGVHAFKCGPDYIDPMFHRDVIGIPSVNLDSFFCDEITLRDVFERNKGEINVIEAAMGLYDGIGVTKKASAYETAVRLNSGIILLVDGYGMGYSIVPLIKGFILQDTHKLIKGVVINRISEKYFHKISSVIELETGIKVYGHIPKMKGAELSNRHLGLMAPYEIKFREKVKIIAEQIEKCVDVDGIVRDFTDDEKETDICEDCKEQEDNTDDEMHAYDDILKGDTEEAYLIAIAKDESFSFMYEENIQFLKQCGGTIEYFSPLHDFKVPEGAKAIIFYGGYPENYPEELSANKSMINSIRAAHSNGTKIIAECGGFMYMLDSLETKKTKFEMVGLIKGYSYRESGLVRFGYANITGNGYHMKGHEFHHYDASGVEYDDTFVVRSESSGEEYRGIIKTDSILAGYPHLYYLSCPSLITDFLQGI